MIFTKLKPLGNADCSEGRARKGLCNIWITDRSSHLRWNLPDVAHRQRKPNELCRHLSFPFLHMLSYWELLKYQPCNPLVYLVPVSERALWLIANDGLIAQRLPPQGIINGCHIGDCLGTALSLSSLQVQLSDGNSFNHSGLHQNYQSSDKSCTPAVQPKATLCSTRVDTLTVPFGCAEHSCLLYPATQSSCPHSCLCRYLNVSWLTFGCQPKMAQVSHGSCAKTPSPVQTFCILLNTSDVSKNHLQPVGWSPWEMDNFRGVYNK